MKILIADDDAVSRTLLERTLRKLGHEVVAVADGLDAIRVGSGADAPALAVLDWMMPGADGLAVCRALRQRTGPYIYVILLTSRDGREDMVAALDAEADDFLTKPFDVVELRARLRSGERVIALQDRLLSTQEALRHEATHDRLTGLFNRATVLDHLHREIERLRREPGPIAVIMADIDHFKRINDTYGHLAGDTVLREAATRIADVPRPYDVVGRYGGEEFLLVLPGSDVAAANAVAERIRLQVSSPAVVLGTEQLPVTISLGVSSTSSSGSLDALLLLQAADEALYRAKAQGRNRVAA